MNTPNSDAPVTDRKRLVFKWGTSTGRRTPGYLRCTLYAEGKKVSRVFGGGYDMKGSALADYIEVAFADRLRALSRPFYGLTYHDPDYDPGTAPLASGKTVAEAEAAGESLGLDRYQATYAAAAQTPDPAHRIPSIDGACGMESVTRIMTAIGLSLATISDKNRQEECTLTVFAMPPV